MGKVQSARMQIEMCHRMDGKCLRDAFPERGHVAHVLAQHLQFHLHLQLHQQCGAGHLHVN